MEQGHKKRLCWAVMGLVLGAIALTLLTPLRLPAADLTLYPSQYSSTTKAPFNQPDYYSITSTPPPNYRSVSSWMGRLILPSVEQYQQVAKETQETDWAWIEVYTAPSDAVDLVGKTVRVAWKREAVTDAYVKAASRDVRFAPDVQKTLEAGIIHPIRLNGRDQVGPLQSLAGAHPYDDVTVVLRGTVQVERLNPPEQTEADLENLTLEENPENLEDQSSTTSQPALVTLRTNREPFQETGRFYGLVKFLKPVPPPLPHQLPTQCPGSQPCASDWMQVQHYNSATGKFDGAQDVIHIPQQPQDNDGVYNMTTRDLAQSPAGEAGWYIYGAPDRAGVFTVEAMQPRSLFLVQPQQTVLDFWQGLKYINFENWNDEAARQGTIQSVLLDATAATPEAAQSEWKVGDRFLVMHLFGGRGGTHENHESFIAGTYAGHFSFGLGEVIQDPFTQAPLLEVNYLQVYGNGGDGTLSGANTWRNYMGSLIRGKAGTRPVSDVLVKLDTLTEDYEFGDTKLSFFNELLSELVLIGARYRIGDGSGDSTITSATSCVQDSAQGLFLTLTRFKQRVQEDPALVEWMLQNPDHPTTQRFLRLVRLSLDMAEELMPMGVVRWDWKQNAEVLTGVRSDQPFISIDNFQVKNLLTGLISWRTAMPRQAHDEFSMLFLRNGASLWFLRPNQIGGYDPGITPLEPTLIFGAWKLPFTNIPILSFLVIRLFGGATIPSWLDWLLTGIVLLGLGAIALPLGFSQGFFQQRPWQAAGYRHGGMLLRLLIVPAFVQELVFRVCLIPYPKRWIPEVTWWAWAFLALGLFVGFQVFYARRIRPALAATLTDPVFLILITLLGLACTIAYRLTGSLWTITALHWIAISGWLLALGGMKKLYSEPWFTKSRRKMRRFLLKM